MSTGTQTERYPEMQEAPRETNGSTVWKWLATFLAGVVLTFGATWATYVRGAVTRAEVSEQIRNEDPYLQDKAAIAVQLEMIRKVLQDQTAQTRALELQLSRISVAMGVDPDLKPAKHGAR